MKKNYYDLTYDMEVSSKKDKEFIDRFNINMRNLDSGKLFDIAENGNLWDFRLLCNSFNSYNKLYPLKYKTQNTCETLLKIKSKCEERINNLFGEYILSLINEIYHTVYNGIESFDVMQLFAWKRPNKKYRGTMIILTNLVSQYPNLIEKQLNLADIKDCIKNESSLLNEPHPKDVYYRKFCMKDQEEYDDRKLCTCAWLEFMDEIFYQSYDTAQNVIDEYYKIRYCGLLATEYWAHPATHVRKRVAIKI